MTRNMHAKLPRVMTRPATSEIVTIPKGTSAFRIDPIPGTAFSGEIMSIGRAATIKPSRRWSFRAGSPTTREYKESLSRW